MKTYPDKLFSAGIDWYKDEPEFPLSAETKRVMKKFRNKISGNENQELINQTSECLAAAKRGQNILKGGQRKGDV